MTDTSQFEKTANLESLFPTKFLETQERNAEILTSANEIVVKTAKAIGENQTEFLQLEAEQASKAFTPVKFDTDAGAAISAYGNQWHEASQKLISHMRTINDLVFDCGWQLFKLGADSFRKPPKQS
jgi:Phasin protein